jgi:hypothetical protein
MTSNLPNSGMRVTTPFRILKPVFTQWQKLSSSSEWLNAGDAPWWYGERASLSSFAGAVWLGGGWAFEEFGAYKKTIYRGKSKWMNGRVDIAFRKGRKYFLAEAKQYWPWLNRNNADVVVSEVVRKLGAACDDVRKVSEHGYTRMGMVFVVPSIHKKKEEYLDNSLSILVEMLMSRKELTVIYAFPKKARKIKAEKPYHDRIYPGVILVARRVGK